MDLYLRLADFNLVHWFLFLFFTAMANLPQCPERSVTEEQQTNSVIFIFKVFIVITIVWFTPLGLKITTLSENETSFLR